MSDFPQQSNYLGKKGTSFQGGMSVSAAIQMPDEEREVLKNLAGMFQASAAFRGRWDRHWPRYWNFWEGNHYFSKIVHTLARAVSNQVFSSIETFVGHVSDIMTDPTFFARRPEFREKAKTITKWLRTEWDRSNAATELQHVLRSAAVTGVGWNEIAYDVNAADFKGAPVYVPCDERYIYLSPHSRNLEAALYLIDARNVPREFVEGAWERGKDIPPGIWYPQVSNERTYSGAYPDGEMYQESVTSDGSQSGWSRLSGSDQQGKKDLVTLIKAWIRQRDGKMRLLVAANGVVLQDGPSPYDDEDFPYVQTNLIPTLDTYCGRSLVQFIESLQEVVDSSLSYLLDVQRYAADPMLVINQANIEDGVLIENMPGATLFDRTEGTNGYNWLQGPGFNQSWMQILENVISMMDSVLGRVDVLKGERPAGVNTLGGLEIIRDEANVRVRNLMRWVKAGVKRSYLLMLSRLRQFVHDERTMRVPNQKGKEEYITVNPVVDQTLEGQPVQEPTIPKDAEFEIDFGPEEPGGEQARREFVLQLAQMPAEDGMPMVPRAWVLDKLDIEEAEEINQFFGEMAQGQAQAEQEAAAAQAAPGGAPAADPMTQDPVRAITELFQGA